jgi:putative GTP pyrophosphokinase
MCNLSTRRAAGGDCLPSDRKDPFAHIWDEESRTFFEGIGIRAEVNPRLYSSVHYVVKARSKKDVTCEIQVRTLADEIWGEVDHKINYPEPHESVACREQIRVLARIASGCSRLVDSIMVTDGEYASRGAETAVRELIATAETSPEKSDADGGSASHEPTR